MIGMKLQLEVTCLRILSNCRLCKINNKLLVVELFDQPRNCNFLRNAMNPVIDYYPKCHAIKGSSSNHLQLWVSEH